MKTAAAHGTTAKHAGTHKHHVTHKHSPAKAKKSHVTHKKAAVHAKAKHATNHKAKGLTPGEMVACCTIEALAASLRLGGLPVTGTDVLGLFRLAGGDDDRGMPIEVALEAASEHGLAGVRLAGFEAADPGQVACAGLAIPDRPLILGAELPGQHTVLATADGWWSWGQLMCPCEFGDVVIDEAWAVTWGLAA